MKLKALIVAACLAAIAGFSSVALSDHHHGTMHGKYHARLSEELDLNNQQQQLLASSRQQMMTAKKRKGELRQQLRAIVHSDSYDAAAVAEIADQMATLTREQIIQHGATMNEFYRSLSPDQRATLETIEQRSAADKGSRQPDSD